ncbi:MAG: AsmA family protein, partial [Bauldia litoralis]
MRRLVKIGLGVVAVAVVAAVALVVFVSAADFGAYRNEIAAAVEQQTGRKITIAGDIDQSVLTLSPSIVLNDVSFSNAPWGRRPQMVTAKRIEISLDLIPLLSGDFHVRRFTLIGADVLLETNAKGEGNWAFWSKEKRAETLAKGKSSSASAAIQNLHIKDSLFTFYDGRS